MNPFVNAKRIVIKLGTSTITHPSGHVNIRRMEELVKTLADIQSSGKELILVSSGAIGVGSGKLGLEKRPTDVPSKQAAAAIGQCELMYVYDKLFSEYNHTVAQMLLTRDVIEEPTRKQNVINTFDKLLGWRIIPIINENDTVATDELADLVIGDNDTLSAIVAVLADADALVLMSDIDGLYTANPKKDPEATLIREVHTIDDKIMQLAGGAGSEHGTGGMITKIHAAQIATKAGVHMAIVNSSARDVLYKLFDGEEIGTHFFPQV